MLQATARKFKKSLATRGVLGTLEVSAAETLRLLQNSYVTRRHTLQPWQMTDIEFDSRYGVNTGGRIPLSNLVISSNNWIYGLHYQAVGIVDFQEILQPLNIDYQDFTFIDLGSGKGRALLMASVLPFKKIIGVEFSEELNDIARDNLSRYPQESINCREIELMLMDASAYVFPSTPLVLYMYNPFEQPVMKQVLEKLVSTFEQHRQRIIVIYYTPECGGLLDKIAFLRKVVSQPDCHIYDSGPV